jgi:DNA-directed RNA polymerase subunit RPC12/RpoP
MAVKMARRRKLGVIKRPPLFKKRGWTYVDSLGNLRKRGVFCPKCGEPLYVKTQWIYKSYVCFGCGYEKTLW